MGRGWKWLGRAADGISIWQLLAPLGIFGGLSWAAAEFQAIAVHGWGAVALAGAGIGCVVLLSLTGSLALYRFFRPLPPAPVPLPEAESAAAQVKNLDATLMETAIAFASARSGRARLQLQNAIQIRDDEEGKGLYISAWDYGVAGPWPSVGTDGFTAFQLRMLPTVFPMLKTQGAREELGAALKELSEVNQQVLATADGANDLRGGMPPLTDLSVFREHWERTARVANDLQGANSRALEYFDQEMLPKKYPLYREEISGTLPRQTAQPYFLELRDALQAYEVYARLMAEIGKTERAGRLTELVSPLYGSIYNDLSRAAGRLREWSIDGNRRIGMMLRAL